MCRCCILAVLSDGSAVYDHSCENGSGKQTSITIAGKVELRTLTSSSPLPVTSCTVFSLLETAGDWASTACMSAMQYIYPWCADPIQFSGGTASTLGSRSTSDLGESNQGGEALPGRAFALVDGVIMGDGREMAGRPAGWGSLSKNLWGFREAG